MNGGGNLKTTCLTGTVQRLDCAQPPHFPEENPTNSIQEAKTGPSSPEEDKGAPTQSQELSQLQVRNIHDCQKSSPNSGETTAAPAYTPPP